MILSDHILNLRELCHPFLTFGVLFIIIQVILCLVLVNEQFLLPLKDDRTNSDHCSYGRQNV